MELVFGAAGLAVAIVALAVTMVAILISLWLRFNSVVSRVRTAILAAEPSLDCTIGRRSHMVNATT